MYKTLPVLILLALGSCAALPPEGTLERFEHDQRRALLSQCLRRPERFGFPYTREEYAILQQSLGPLRGREEFCLRVVDHLRR